MNGPDPAPRPGRSNQHWKAPPQFFRSALDAGIPLRCLRSIVSVGVVAAGHREGRPLKGSTIGRRTARSRRTVQRDFSLIGAAGLKGVIFHRSAPAPDGNGGYQSAPTRYQVPRASSAPGTPGTIVWAQYLTRPEYLGATATAQGLWLLLLEICGPDGFSVSAKKLARRAGVSVSCVRAGLRYWRQVGWLEVSECLRPDGGRAANHYRPLAARELEELNDQAEEDLKEQIDRIRGRRRRAYVARWVALVAVLDLRAGGTLAEQLADIEAGYSEGTQAVEQLAERLAELKRRGVYRGPTFQSRLTEAIPAALKQLAARAEELAGRSAEELAEQFGERRWVAEVKREAAELLDGWRAAVGPATARIWLGAVEPVGLTVEGALLVQCNTEQHRDYLQRYCAQQLDSLLAGRDWSFDAGVVLTVRGAPDDNW